MRRAHFFRAITLFLAFIHTFPARRHLGEFFAQPSWDEGWKGFGAVAAIALYLLPPLYQLRLMRALFRQWPFALRAGGVVLTVVHLVPAFDHVPRFFAAPSLGDAWRGFGAAMAAVWFLLPLDVQLRIVNHTQHRLAQRWPSGPALAASRLAGVNEGVGPTPR